MNVSDINVLGYRKISDYCFFEFVNLTSDILGCITAVISNLRRDVDDEFPPRNGLKITGGILVGWLCDLCFVCLDDVQA